MVTLCPEAQRCASSRRICGAASVPIVAGPIVAQPVVAQPVVARPVDLCSLRADTTGKSSPTFMEPKAIA